MVYEKSVQKKERSVTLSSIKSNIQHPLEIYEFDDTLLNAEFDTPPIHSTIYDAKKLLNLFE